jgi:hypothetical protein
MKSVLPVIRLAVLSFFKKDNIQMLLLLLLLGSLYAYLGNQLAVKLNQVGNPITFQQARLLFYVFTLVPVFASFIPILVTKKKWVPAYFPVLKRTWAFVDLISSFFSAGAISGLAMLVSFIITYRFGSPIFITAISLLFIMGNLAANVFINILSWRKFGWLIALALVIAGFVLLMEYGQVGLPGLVTVAVVAVLIFILLSFLTFSLIPANDLKVVFRGRSGRNRILILLKETIHTGHASTPLLIALIVKAAALFFFPIREISGVPFASVNVFHFFLFTPIFLFLNVFNNAFGFFPGVYAITYSFSLSFKSLFTMYIRLIVPFLLADFLISMAFLVSHRDIGSSLLLLYVSVIPYYISIGFAVSLLFGKKISAFSWGSLKGNTHVAANLLIALPIFLSIFYAIEVPVAVIAYGTLFSSVILLLVVLPVVFTRAGYTLFQKIKE